MLGCWKSLSCQTTCESLVSCLVSHSLNLCGQTWALEPYFWSQSPGESACSVLLLNRANRDTGHGTRWMHASQHVTWLWSAPQTGCWGKSRSLLPFSFWQFDVYLVSFMYFDFYLSIVGMCCPSLSTPFPRRSHCTVPILVLSLLVWMYCSV